MFSQFLTIGIMMFLTALLPGPDFAMVTKNTILYSRRAGLLTSLGVGSAILVHICYCALGLALVISNSIIMFNTIKLIGAGYLIYLGVSSLIAKKSTSMTSVHHNKQERVISDCAAFRQGFLCNLLNPKATLFFLALFTMIIKPNTPPSWILMYAIEMFTIITVWFSCLTLMMSHHRVLHVLNKMEHHINKALGVFLVGFGVALAFVKK